MYSCPAFHAPLINRLLSVCFCLILLVPFNAFLLKLSILYGNMGHLSTGKCCLLFHIVWDPVPVHICIRTRAAASEKFFSYYVP